MRSNRFQVSFIASDDSRIAKRSSETLSRYVSHNLSVRVGSSNDEIELPENAVRLLNAVTLIPVHAELTTKQAADVIGVSRPFLMWLLEEGVIPYRKVGTHRRILFEDVQAYRKRVTKERENALNQLVEEAQHLDMGY